MHDLIRKALKSLPADAPEGLEVFMRDFFEAVPEEDIALIEPDEILRTAQTHFLLSKKRARPVIAIMTTSESANTASNAGHANIVKCQNQLPVPSFRQSFSPKTA